jgi:hypothetical protein
VVTADGQRTVADAEAWIAAFEAALARDEPFAAVLVSLRDGPAPKSDPAAAHRSMTWLNEARPRLAERVRGVAYVLASAEERAAAEAIVPNGERLYGCPVAVLDSLDDAVEWAQAQVRGPADQTPRPSID